MKKQITVIGATGNLGVPVVKYLDNFGYHLKIVARDVHKAQKIFGRQTNATIVYADLNDVQSLKNALEDTAYLYLNLSTTSKNMHARFKPEIDGVSNILKAINRSVIKQILLISGLGAMENNNGKTSFEFLPNIIRKQGHKLIKESGIPYTILHCSWFIDSFVLFRNKGTYTVIGNNKAPIYFTNCYDYSMNLNNAIGNKDAEYKEFPIQGNEGLIHSEAAKTFLNLYNKESKVKIMPQAMLKTLAIFIKDLKFIKHLAEYTIRCPESFLAEDCGTYDILGKPKLNLESYAMMIEENGLYKQ